jgi:leucyl aminopeptidase
MEEHRKAMRSDFADLTNSAKSRYGGASHGAAFLEHFFKHDSVKRWAHLDIAGPADVSAPHGFWTKGATGFGTMTLLNYINKIQKSSA